MEDEHGLELSLGLSFGGSSVKCKGKSGSSSEAKTEESDQGNKVVDDLRNFFNASGQREGSSTASQKSGSVKPQDNFFNDLSKVPVDADASIELNGMGPWVANNNRSEETDEEKRSEAGSKRKIFFDEISNQKKHEGEAHLTDLPEKSKVSHISITSESGSIAENEDVAESEVGSASRILSHHDDGCIRFTAVGGSCESGPKGVHGSANSSVVDLQGQINFNGSAENDFRLGNLPSTVPINIMNVPYSVTGKDSNSVSAASTSGHPPGMKSISILNGDHQTGSQLMFGYSSLQLPMLDKDSSSGFVSQLQQFHSSFSGRSTPNSDKYNDGLMTSQAMHLVARNTSKATQYDGKKFEQARGDGKQHARGEASSFLTEEERINSMNLRGKEGSDRSAAEGISFDFSAIKPGIAADVKFGGSGSYPNLPWVSTTGPGPNGRTISGVTYRYSTNQIRIVCACHGTHMSLEEFVRHAAEDNVNSDSGSGLATFSSANPAASAQS
ncbi:hypothetical protein HS088_TW09G01052 [Tripterygium wilfordii]|uniref:Ninja-family protein n=1 Tax=Tripterygium wilfordii TaxID=458696 RepID=A0A7J7D9E7_TRIWF|nr:ninja-family protein mc410-like isoform X2 [Tripterygium wilfordii]KAF5742990.1 hypothetical protein HS088_TW09G01052 [Tripterygium wilfordii]